MPRRKAADTIVKPDPAAERQLRAAQRAVIRGTAAAQERNCLLARLFADGYTQPALTDLLNAEQKRAGLPPVTGDAVQKAIRRASCGEP